MSFPPKPDAFRTVTKHDSYYIAGADLCILVENVQFRVHRFFFERESGYFIRKLATPATPGQSPQGTNDSNAIMLDDVTAEHFATFLWVFYNPLYSLYEAKTADWEIILDLAVRWEFPEVKNLAVRELEKKEIPDSKRIKLYHANQVDRNILIPRYAALCEREAHLTLEEGQDIGLETVLMIAAGREQARASRLASGVRSPLSPTIRGVELHDVIREVFQIAPAPKPDPTGGLPRTPLTKSPTALTLTPMNRLSPKIKNGRPTAAAAAAATTKRTKPNNLHSFSKPTAAQGLDGSVAGVVDDGSLFDTEVEATTTQGMGGDDLLGISFSGFNQTPSSSAVVPPLSLFDPFSSFGTPAWSQKF